MIDSTKTSIDYVALGYKDGLKDVPPKHEENQSYMTGYARAMDRKVRKEMKNITGIFN